MVHTRPRSIRWPALLLVLATFAAACTDDAASEPDPDATSTTSAPSSSSTAGGTASTVVPSSSQATTSTPLTVPTEPPPVYVLVLDELPIVNLLTDDGDLNATRFPAFAELASRSTWYTNWSIHSGRTIHSVPALLSGVLPRNTLATPDQYPSNLIDGLAVAGWGAHVLEHNSWLCREGLCPGRLPYPRPEHRPVGVVADGYFGELESGAAPGQTLHLLHLVTPHPPWNYLPDGSPSGSAGEGVVGARWPSTPWMSSGVAAVESLWQLGYTDRLLQRWIDAIEARGEWDDALVIVTADHGEDLQPGHNSRDIRADNQHEMVWVPTFVKRPGQQQGSVVADPHTASELVRIVYDSLGLTLPEGVGMHQRLVVTDVWPYVEGTPLSFAPVDESARPTVTGDFAAGPGWAGLVDDARRRLLPDAVADLVGEPVGAAPALVAPTAEVDFLSLLRGARRGECGWDASVAGNLSTAPDPARPYVALAVGGQVVGVAPVDAVWPGAAAEIEDRPSYFRILVDPDDAAVYDDPQIYAVDGSGTITGRYPLAEHPADEPFECPT